MAALRIIFMGTPDLAAASLRALLRESAFQIIAVVTQPDRPKGRDPFAFLLPAVLRRGRGAVRRA